MAKTNVPNKATNASLTLEVSSKSIGGSKTPIVSSISLENKKVTIGKK